MAKVNQRLWKIPGQRTKRKAWGFTAQINGKQVRRYKAEWTQDDAEAELAKALLQVPVRQVVYDLLAALPEPRTGRIWHQGNVRTAFESAVEAAGLEDFHFHDL